MLTAMEKFKLNYLIKKDLEQLVAYIKADSCESRAFLTEEFNTIYNLREKLKTHGIIDNSLDNHINELYKSFKENNL